MRSVRKKERHFLIRSLSRDDEVMSVMMQDTVLMNRVGLTIPRYLHAGPRRPPAVLPKRRDSPSSRPQNHARPHRDPLLDEVCRATVKSKQLLHAEFTKWIIDDTINTSLM